MRFHVTFETTVELEINDPSVLVRVLENHDDEGEPQPRHRGGPGWRDTFYDLDRDGAVAMLAANLGLSDRFLSSLDGWADLPNEAADARVFAQDVIDVAEL